jgi:hypothetical protein
MGKLPHLNFLILQYSSLNTDLTNIKENQDENQPPSPSFTLLSLRRFSRSFQKEPAPLSSLQEKINQLEQSKSLMEQSKSQFPLQSSSMLPASSIIPPQNSTIPPSSTDIPIDIPPSSSPIAIPSFSANPLPLQQNISFTNNGISSPSSAKKFFLDFLNKTRFFEKETQIEVKKEVLELMKGFAHYGEDFLGKEEERKKRSEKEERKVKTRVNLEISKEKMRKGLLNFSL